MKKLQYIICVIFVLALFSSCRVHERCPAYGKVDKVEVERPV